MTNLVQIKLRDSLFRYPDQSLVKKSDSIITLLREELAAEAKAAVEKDVDVQV
jgi:hypothetical protein